MTRSSYDIIKAYVRPALTLRSKPVVAECFGRRPRRPL